jgi:hypothetical protein
MSPIKRFEEAASNQTVRINSLEVDRMNRITHAEILTTKYGPTVLMTIKDSENSVNVFIPRRYGAIITDTDISEINTQKET